MCHVSLVVKYIYKFPQALITAPVEQINSEEYNFIFMDIRVILLQDSNLRVCPI